MPRDAIGIASGLSRRRNGFDSRTRRGFADDRRDNAGAFSSAPQNRSEPRRQRSLQNCGREFESLRTCNGVVVQREDAMFAT